MRTPTGEGRRAGVAARTVVKTTSKVNVGTGRAESGTVVVGSSQTLTVSWCWQGEGVRAIAAHSAAHQEVETAERRSTRATRMELQLRTYVQNSIREMMANHADLAGGFRCDFI